MKRRIANYTGLGQKTKRTRAGEQHVIPGTEKVSDAETAKRRAREPLKPRVAQKPADEGLFGDGANQTDLFDPRKAKFRQTLKID